MTDRLLDALLDGEVHFVIVGGVAAVLHGSTMLTRDLDICVPLGASNFLRVQSALKALNPRVRAGAGYLELALDEAHASALKNLHITTDDGRLDCLGFIAGIGSFDEVVAASEAIEVGGRKCRILGLDGLIRAKEAMGRPHDLATVVQLKALRERRGALGNWSKGR